MEEVSEWSLNVDSNKHLRSGPDSVSLALSDGFYHWSVAKGCGQRCGLHMVTASYCSRVERESTSTLWVTFFLCELSVDRCLGVHADKTSEIQNASIALDCGWYVTVKKVFSHCQLPDKIIISHVWVQPKLPLTWALLQNLVTNLNACLIKNIQISLPTWSKWLTETMRGEQDFLKKHKWSVLNWLQFWSFSLTLVLIDWIVSIQFIYFHHFSPQREKNK